MTPIDLGHHCDSEVQPGLVDFAVNVGVPEPPTSGWARTRPWPGQSMMKPMAIVAYLEENLCPC